jgi:glucosamine 6-phosphate synthetase-like amidotransferase/phosphosugar isomerase protein
MKHGPIALIDETMPVVAIATQDPLYDKMISQIQQAKARGGVVIALATEGDEAIRMKQITWSTCRPPRRCWRLSSTRCRCNCLPTTLPCAWAAT